jgi:outer membrane protein assembly factor BamB
MYRSAWLALPGVFLALCPCNADSANGWRGNGTGLYPDSTAPLEWYRLPRGLIADLRTRAEGPGESAQGTQLEKGVVREWLIIGPFPVKDSVTDLDKEQLADEPNIQPAENDKAGALVWKKLTAEIDDPFAFGPATPPVTDIAAEVGGYKNNQVAYLHTYIYSPRPGTVRAVVEHAHGLKAWLNGTQIYRASERAGGMGNYYAFSRVEFGTSDLNPSPRFDLNLKRGWNRFLLKGSTYNKQGWTDQGFLLRLMDMPDVPYETKNILWMTELSQRSNATPIVVGDRVFVMAEPDELICLNKVTGQILWKAANNYYEALAPEDRQANPAFREKVDPLVAAIDKEKDFVKRMNLRKRLKAALIEIDPARFKWNATGHYEEHFGIVGFTTPSPVSDGKHVWIWCGNGIAASYDLDGKRRWITRVPIKQLSYTSSPALNSGILAVSVGLERLVGFDAATGKVCWEQEEIKGTNGSVLAATLSGVPVFLSDHTVIRARDGHILFTEPQGGGAWTCGVARGDVFYPLGYGINQLSVLDFTGARGDSWEPKRGLITAKGVGRLPNGKAADRSTAASPLVVGDLAYTVDIYAAFYAYDLKARRFLYQQDTGMRGYFHYCAVPVTASPALIGKHIVIQDNQGTALVLEPGPMYQVTAKNQIATQMDRYWPVPAQETIGYAPPVADGGRLYIRGERYLYCIGEK